MQYLKPNVKYLKRDVDDYFRNWKSDEWHHALIVIGARQVGKTTSILHFAKFNYKNVIYIDLEESDGIDFINFIKSHPKKTKDLLTDYFNLHGLHYTDSNDTIIIFDEIQNSEQVWSLIRPIDVSMNCDLIVTGSALSKTKKWFIPAGNFETLRMHTMSFPEFLGCLGYRDKYNSCEIDKLTENQDAWFRNVFEIYCKVGGYPAAVQAYLQNKDYEKVLDQLLEILKKELNNTSEFKTTKERIPYLLEVLVKSLLKEKKVNNNLLEYLVTSVNELTPSNKASKKEIDLLINWLIEVDVISICDGINLATNTILEKQRIYFNDVGFLNYIMSLFPVDSDNALGLLSETFIHKVFYNMASRKSSLYFGIYNNYEYDFVLVANKTGKKKLIEVKHKNGKSKSMEFAIKKNLADYYYFYFGDTGYKSNDCIERIPIYFADRTLIDDIIESECTDVKYETLPPFPSD